MTDQDSTQGSPVSDPEVYLEEVKAAIDCLNEIYNGISTDVLRNGSRVKPSSFVSLAESSRPTVRGLIEGTLFTRNRRNNGSVYILRWDKDYESFVVLLQH